METPIEVQAILDTWIPTPKQKKQMVTSHKDTPEEDACIILFSASAHTHGVRIQPRCYHQWPR